MIIPKKIGITKYNSSIYSNLFTMKYLATMRKEQVYTPCQPETATYFPSRTQGKYLLLRKTSINLLLPQWSVNKYFILLKKTVLVSNAKLIIYKLELSNFEFNVASWILREEFRDCGGMGQLSILMVIKVHYHQHSFNSLEFSKFIILGQKHEKVKIIKLTHLYMTYMGKKTFIKLYLV